MCSVRVPCVLGLATYVQAAPACCSPICGGKYQKKGGILGGISHVWGGFLPAGRALRCASFAAPGVAVLGVPRALGHLLVLDIVLGWCLVHC
jgi:hypothetical protein